MKSIDIHDSGQEQDFIGPAETDKHDLVGTAEADHGKSKDDCMPAASDSDNQGHEGVGGVRQSAYQGIDGDVSCHDVRSSDHLGGTYDHGHGHGQEHEQEFDVAEPSACASVAITSDPSRVSCSTSTTETVLKTTIDDDRSEHEALDPITQAVLIPDVSVLMKPHDHDTTTTMDINRTYITTTSAPSSQSLHLW